MNPQTIINEALEIGRRLNVQIKNKKHEEKALETVFNTQIVSRKCFIDNLSNIKNTEINKFFADRVNECNLKAEKIVQKNRTQTIKCINDSNKFDKENSKIADELTVLNSNCKEIESKIKESNETISGLQIKFNMFENLKCQRNFVLLI